MDDAGLQNCLVVLLSLRIFSKQVIERLARQVKCSKL